jgi:hypothetical protein
VPGISIGWPSRVSRWVSIVISAEDAKSACVYLDMIDHSNSRMQRTRVRSKRGR